MYSSTGILRSDPVAKSIPNPGKWWLIIEADPELGRYLRWQYNLFYRGHSALNPPAWQTHISVVRGEEPPCQHLWGCWDGLEIDFRYRQEVFSNEKYVWMSVACEQAVAIRRDLGLAAEPEVPFHLTVGIMKE